MPLMDKSPLSFALLRVHHCSRLVYNKPWDFTLALKRAVAPASHGIAVAPQKPNIPISNDREGEKVVHAKRSPTCT